MEVLFLLLGLPFVAAQGGAVFATAYLGLRWFKTTHWFAKICAMVVSYVGWIVLSGTVWALVGGGWGMMEGGPLVASLFFTCLVSSAVYLAAWLIAGLIWRKPALREGA